MGVDKGKKQKLEEIEEGNDGQLHIDGELVLSIEKLQEIQEELEKINGEASDKVLEVEQKYTAIRKPVYDKRNEHIKSIPDFWLTAFMSHPALGELLTEKDQKIFKYLGNLEVEEFKDVKSEFHPNPYFEISALTKTFTFLEEGTTSITATSIKWKEGVGIPNGVVEEKNGNKRSYAEERYEPYYTVLRAARQALREIIWFLGFLTWFSETQHKGDMVEIHDEVAEIIKDDLWPNPLTYFNNDADEEELDMDEDDEKMMMRSVQEKGRVDSEDEDDGEDEDEE